MASLSNVFVLSLVVAVWLALHGGLRLRRDPEQTVIWGGRGMKLPERFMPLWGATQVAAGVATVLRSSIGLPAAVAVAVVEAGLQALRLRTGMVAALYLAVGALAAALAVVDAAAAPMTLLLAAAAGAAAFIAVHTSFPAAPAKRA